MPSNERMRADDPLTHALRALPVVALLFCIQMSHSGISGPRLIDPGPLQEAADHFVRIVLWDMAEGAQSELASCCIELPRRP